MQSIRYSKPARAWYVIHPTTGKWSQFYGVDARAKARKKAAAISAETGQAVKPTPSRCYYVYETRPGHRRGTRVSAGQTTEPAAKAWLDQRVAAQQPYLGRKRLVTVDQALDEWLAFKKSNRRKPIRPSTLRSYREYAKAWRLELGEEFVANVTPGDIRKLFDRLERGELGKNRDAEDGPVAPKNSTLQRHRAVIKSFFSWCGETGRQYIDRNPVDVDSYRVDTEEPEVLTPDQLRRLLRACHEKYTVEVVRGGKAHTRKHAPPPHLYGIVLIAIHTSMRLGNCLDLRWGHIDFDRERIVRPGSDMKNRERWSGPMSKTLAEYLRSLPRGAPAAPIFGSSLGSIRRAFSGAAERAGLPGLRFHSLRKTSATLLLEAGVSLKTVQSLGGWKRPEVLLRHYASASEESKRLAVSRLDELVG